MYACHLRIGNLSGSNIDRLLQFDNWAKPEGPRRFLLFALAGKTGK